VPYALCAFSGRLLAGVGKSLRLYELGQKKMLRKCQMLGLPYAACPGAQTLGLLADSSRNLLLTALAPTHARNRTMAQSIHVLSASRIVVGDLAESFLFVKYKRTENTLTMFADEAAPRWLTSACVIDLNTLAGADKFGNVFVVRLPQEVRRASHPRLPCPFRCFSSSLKVLMPPPLSAPPTCAGVGRRRRRAAAHDGRRPRQRRAVEGRRHRPLPYRGHGHVAAEGRAGARLRRGAAVHDASGACTLPSKPSAPTYGAHAPPPPLSSYLQGGIGALLPFSSKEDLELLTALEMHLRQVLLPLPPGASSPRAM